MTVPLNRADCGFTLVEATIVLCLMTVALLTGLSVLNQSAAQTEEATTLFLNNDRARAGLSGMFDIMAEASISHVDTAMRIHGPLVANDVFSDRFTIPGVVLRQCTNPACAFHTRADLTVFADRCNCSREYRTGLLGGPITRGKNWPATMSACPLDGWPLSTAPRLDGAKFFIARTESGSFTKTASGTPYWGGLVLLFPYVSHRGLCELRRYDVYVSDLLAGTVSYSPSWNRFAPLTPSMIDLFDFGSDGTTDGFPDGKVPLTNSLSDAITETFAVGTYQGTPTILVTKSMPNGGLPGGFPQRQLTLRIALDTGETEFSVDHKDTNTLNWTASCNFTRTPRTVIQGLTELAISTSVSDPHHPVANPMGVSQPRVVRITIGTSDPAEGNKWFNHVESFEIKTRN